MKIHEYQGKELLRRFDVKVPRGIVARTVAEAEDAAKELGLPVVIKAQIHAGGRGKGGGVKLARSAEDVHNLAKQILGMNLVTHQTGPEGRTVHTLLIEEGLKINRNSIWACCWIVLHQSWCLWLQSLVVWTSKKLLQPLQRKS